MRTGKRTHILGIAATFLVLISLVFLSVSCGKIPVSLKEANVILITADALRPDHLSCYGYEHIETGAIDSLAEKGLLFEKAYCNNPSTLYGYVSILSGKSGASFISRKGTYYTVDDSLKPISEYLKEAGYNTAAVVSDPLLLRKETFEKGFDVFENLASNIKANDLLSLPEKETAKALELLKEYKGKGNPFFPWLEYTIPRMPFFLPRDFEEAKGDFPYDRQVLFLDLEISKLLKGLDELGLDNNTIIILTSTHGESLGEHG